MVCIRLAGNLHIYKEWCAIARGSQYNVNERSELTYSNCANRTFLYL